MREGVNIEYIQQFGKNIAKIRKSKNMTQENLAFASNLALSQIARIETAKINPSLDTIYRISIGLEIHPKELFHFDFL